MDEQAPKNPYAQILDPEQLSFLRDSVQNRVVELEKLLDSSLENRLDKIYQIKMAEARTHLNQIEDFLDAVTQGNCVSIEQVFTAHRTYETPIILWLKPETESHALFGNAVTADMLLTNEEAQELMKNMEANERSYGPIRLKPVRPADLNDKQIDILTRVGIPTCDIREVWLS